MVGYTCFECDGSGVEKILEIRRGNKVSERVVRCEKCRGSGGLLGHGDRPDFSGTGYELEKYGFEKSYGFDDEGRW